MNCLYQFPPPLQHGESPLHIAAGYGRLRIVKLLRSHGASTDAKDKVRETEVVVYVSAVVVCTQTQTEHSNGFIS